MRVPRIRLTIGHLMIGVAVVATTAAWIRAAGPYAAVVVVVAAGLTILCLVAAVVDRPIVPRNARESDGSTTSHDPAPPD